MKDFHSCRLLYVRFRNPALAFLLLFNNTGGGGASLMAVPGCPLCSGGPRSLPPPTQAARHSLSWERETRALKTNWGLSATERSFTWAGNALVLRAGEEAGSEVMGLRERCLPLLPDHLCSSDLGFSFLDPPAWSPPLQLPHSTAASTAPVKGTLGDQHSLCPH